MEPPSHKKTNRSHTALGLALVLIGMIGLRSIARLTNPARHSPVSGHHRGDVLLSDCLPDKISIWRKTQFQPGKFGTHVCSHRWTYQSDLGAALVSFDQAAFSGWHELTDCYAMSGWSFQERQRRNEHSEWPCVQADFVKDGRNSVILYSLFYDNGTGVVPPAYSVGNETNQDQSAIQRLAARASKPQPGTTRQCQLLFLLNTDNAPSVFPHLLKLHLKTRQELLREFLRKQDSTASKKQRSP